MSSGNERRQFYRLRYPATFRPTLVLETGQRFEVVDLSESGLVFQRRKAVGVGTAFRGQLNFRDGERTNVEGVVIREATRESVATIQGVTSQRMMLEQRYILMAYPQRKLLKG